MPTDHRPTDWTPYVSAYLDNELDPEMRRAFEEKLARNPALRKEVDEVQKVKNVMGGLALRPLPDQAYDYYLDQTYNRLERGIGWILLSMGAIVLVGYGLYELVSFLAAEAELAWWVRAAIGAVCAGLAILLISVVRERVFVWKQDPYREVKR